MPTSSSRRWRRVLATSVAAFTLLGAATACSSSNTGGGGGNSKPIVIGASLSLTGDFSDSGKAVQRGYQLWASETNAHGGLLGRKVQVKIVDDTSSPNQVVSNYQNLITREHVDMVFGPFSSLLTIPASQIAKRYGYAFLEPAGGSQKVFDQHLNNLFFIQPAPAVEQGLVFADYILSLPASERPKTAAYPSLDDPFSSPIADAIRAKFEAAGIKTVYKDVYAAETPDLTPVMSKVAAAKPDVIVSGTQSTDAYQQVKALIQLGYNPKWLYMSNGANSPVEFPANVGKRAPNGIFSSADWFPGSTASGSAEFTKAYIAKYGGTANDIDPSTAEAYATGQVLAAGLKQVGKVDNKSLITTLHAGSYSTVLGTLKWDADGAPSGVFTLVQWVGNTLTPVFPSGSAKHAPVAPKPAWAS